MDQEAVGGEHGENESGEIFVEEFDFVNEMGETETRRKVTRKKTTLEQDPTAPQIEVRIGVENPPTPPEMSLRLGSSGINLTKYELAPDFQSANMNTSAVSLSNPSLAHDK